MGSLMRVKVWRIKPYISTNGQKVAGVSYQIRRESSQDWKDLPIIVFSPWNCDFLKLCVPQGDVLPGHGILRHLGFKLFTWRKPQENTEHNGMSWRVAFVKMWQCLMEPLQHWWLLPLFAAQPWKVYVEFKGSRAAPGHDGLYQSLPGVLRPCIASIAGTKLLGITLMGMKDRDKGNL